MASSLRLRLGLCPSHSRYDLLPRIIDMPGYVLYLAGTVAIQTLCRSDLFPEDLPKTENGLRPLTAWLTTPGIT